MADDDLPPRAKPPGLEHAETMAAKMRDEPTFWKTMWMKADPNVGVPAKEVMQYYLTKDRAKQAAKRSPRKR